MGESYLCDYCRAAINPQVDSSLIVAVHRRVDEDEWGDVPSTLLSGEELAYRYCSQQHAGQHLERIPLPPVSPDVDTAGTFATLWAVVVGLGGAFLLAYGGVQFWQEVARGWVSSWFTGLF